MKITRLVASLSLAFAVVFTSAHAFAQSQVPSGNIRGNATASTNVERSITPTEWFNRWCSSTQWRVPVSGAGTWSCIAATGTGSPVFSASPTLTTPALGTPSALVLTNATGLPLSGHAAQAAWSFVVNNTSGSAAPTAVDIASFTTKASPAAGDFIVLSDQAASGALKKATVSSVASAGSVSSIAGNTGAFTLSNGITNSTNDIRLDPATAADQETATSAVKPVTPAVQQRHPSSPKFWVSCTASGTSYTVVASYNGNLTIGPATNGCGRTGLGVGTLAFTTAFAGADTYGCVGTPYNSGGGQMTFDTRAAGQVAYDLRNNAGSNTDMGFSAMCFGDQ